MGWWVRMRIRQAALPLIVTGLSASCKGVTYNDVVCTEVFAFGLSVAVVDSVAGVPPDSALMVARSGSFVDSLGPIPAYTQIPDGKRTLVFVTAGERAGSYDLIVRSAGYRDWTRQGVVVTRDNCHVHPVSLTARLQRLP